MNREGKLTLLLLGWLGLLGLAGLDFLGHVESGGFDGGEVDSCGSNALARC